MRVEGLGRLIYSGFGAYGLHLDPTTIPDIACEKREFRVQGPGFRVQGSGFRNLGSGFRVQGPGFRLQGSGLIIYSGSGAYN